jgi:rfaE bifunctional protein nucleotidyltransferase chain/domain
VSIHDKLLERQAAIARYSRPRAERLVFTNGCFDVLHRGHVEYLESARTLGDRLVVGLNSDESVRRLKGPRRPLNTAADRAVVLAALAAVDAVVVFEDDTPLSLIAALQPDVLVKGGDYSRASIVGAEQVEATGGEVVVIALVPGRSTTGLIERMTRS